MRPVVDGDMIKPANNCFSNICSLSFVDMLDKRASLYKLRTPPVRGRPAVAV